MLLEHLHDQVASRLHQQLRALAAITPAIRAAEALETRLRDHGLEAAAAGQVGDYGASVHVVCQAEARQVAAVLCLHSLPFERDMPDGSAGVTALFRVALAGQEIPLVVLSAPLCAVPA